jgi:hypothetical protein
MLAKNIEFHKTNTCLLLQNFSLIIVFFAENKFSEKCPIFGIVYMTVYNVYTVYNRFIILYYKISFSII